MFDEIKYLTKANKINSDNCDKYMKTRINPNDEKG